MRKISQEIVVIAFVLSSAITGAQNCNSGFKTFTIGGWGSECSGNNPGCYRDQNFSQAFPNGLAIGCGLNQLVLTSSQAVQDFLPSGGTSSTLNSGILINPGQSYSNVLAAQLVGVTLALGFDTYDTTFSDNSSSLGDLRIGSGPFEGMRVGDFLELANDVIGGCQLGYSLSDLNATATAINENYDNGTVNNGFLICDSFRIGAITIDSNVDCYGFQNGQITLNVAGGEPPYIYALSNGMTSGYVQETAFTFTGLAAGNFSVTITDAAQNTATGNAVFTISQPSQIQVVTSATAVRCFGESNGSASISSITGGVGPYLITWFNGSTAQTVTNLVAGTYSGTITDSLGCMMPFSVSIDQPQILAAVTVSTAVRCFGGDDGSLTASISGGTGPYTILWSTGATDTSITGLSAGIIYSAQIIDANGCEINIAAFVTEPAPLVLSVVKEKVLCVGGTAIAVASATGGMAPFTYSWNTNPIQEGDLAYLQVGTWEVTVTDANGCSTSTNVTMVLQSCEGFTTVTQGGWGAKCAGNNWGNYLRNNFAVFFPNGLTVGAGSRFLRLTSASAVQAFLPSGTTPRALNSGTLVNPTTRTYSNVLAGQTVALTLNIAFDFNANFSPSSQNLGDLVLTSGPLVGLNVYSVLDLANQVLGGISTPFTAAQVNDALDRINRNYDNGAVNLGFLTCPCRPGSKLAATVPFEVTIYPNPATHYIQLVFDVINYPIKIEVYTLMGQVVLSRNYEMDRLEGHEIRLDLDNLKSGMYIVRVLSGNETVVKNIIVK